MKDQMDKHPTTEEILLRQAEEIAREQSRNNGADIDLAPWGGQFSAKPLRNEIHAVGKIGNC
jgi:hypothetical protein